MSDKPIGGCGFDEHCAETTIVVHGRSGREHVVVKLFSGRAAKLEAMNRILTDSARQRAERVEELERKIDIMEPQLLDARTRLKILENIEDAATERAARIQELENELRELRIEYANKDVPRVEAEREFYRKRMNELEQHNQQLTEAANKCAERMNELEEHNRQVTEAATKYAKRAQDLEQELSAVRAERNDEKRLGLS
jgi:chromosome segregation ATPase